MVNKTWLLKLDKHKMLFFIGKGVANITIINY